MNEDGRVIWFLLPREGKPSCYDVNRELVGRIRDITKAHICDTGGVCRKCGAVMPTTACPISHSMNRSVSGLTAINYIVKFRDTNGDRIIVTVFYAQR